MSVHWLAAVKTNRPVPIQMAPSRVHAGLAIHNKLMAHVKVSVHGHLNFCGPFIHGFSMINE